MVSAKWMAGSALAMVLAAVGAAHADVAISKKGTANMSCVGGVCSPTAKDAVLNATDLANMLASGDVTVTTGSGAANIVVKDGFSWTSTARLTLDAMQSVEFDKPVSVAGSGAVTITTNDGGSGGDLLFGEKANLTFWDTGSSLIINGNSYLLVKKLKDLKKAIAANPAGFFALAGNYNAHKDGTYTKAVIGTVGASQTIEGLGNQIQNLTMASSAHPVLALIKENDGVIRDLGLTNVNINGSNTSAAGIAWISYGTLSNVFVSGTITALGDAGGVVDGNGGTITHSRAAVSLSATDPSSFAGAISAGNGGLIQTSYTTGAVSGGYAGGLVGFNSGEHLGTVSQSYSAVAVSVVAGSTHPVGGLVGEEEGTISNSYSTGDITGGGGAIGTNDGAAVTAIYSTGLVNAAEGGGLVYRDNTQTFANCYWDLDTSGISDPHHGAGSPPDDPGITGLTDQELKSGLPSGFDPKIWAQNPRTNAGYPYLRAVPPP